MSFNVISSGFLASIQDSGRFGFAFAGVAPGGAMDWYAMEAANHIVGNDPGLAVMECYGNSPELIADDNYLVAGTGRGYSLIVSGRKFPSWMAVLIRKGMSVYLEPSEDARWGYLAVSGGFDLPLVLGSRSTDFRGGFGGMDGRYLNEGDSLPVGQFSVDVLREAGTHLHSAFVPDYGGGKTLYAVAGPQRTHFTTESVDQFWSGEFRVSTLSDRMGYRLAGPALEPKEKKELLSEGVVPGVVQVLPSGQAIILMAGAQTTGGYPKIAVVAHASQNTLAQMISDDEVLSFSPITVNEARLKLKELRNNLANGVIPEDEERYY